MANVFEAIIDYLMEITSQIGYIGVIAIVGLEYACFPMPSEIVLPFVGFLATSSKMSFIGVLIASTFAGILGSLVCYYIGYFGGKPVLDKIGHKVPSTRKSIFAAKETFEKYDKISVMIARCSVGKDVFPYLQALPDEHNQVILFSFIGFLYGIQCLFP